MNILVYSDYSRMTHSVRPEAEIFLQLAARGHEVCVFSPQLDEREPFTGAGVRTATTGQTGKISISSIRLLRAELERKRYDIVFATSSHTIPSAAFACIGFDCKLVVYRGTTRGLKRHDPSSFLTVLHPRVDAVVTASDAVRESVRKKLYRNRDKVVSIFKGHDIDWYSDEPADLAEFGIPAGAIVAIAVARFRPTKGLRYLLEATQLLADIKALHLLVVGSGADEEPYTGLVADSAMAERIHVIGRRDDALSLIAAADMLVQPSVDGEGLPRSIVEALGFGKPVISTTVGGAKEILEEGKTGLLIPPADAKAIAQSVRTLALDTEAMRAMSEHCRGVLRTHLSHIRTAEAYERFFQSVCRDQPTGLSGDVRDAGDAGDAGYAVNEGEVGEAGGQGGETTRLEVSHGYTARTPALLRLLDEFAEQGTVLHEKRNTIKKMQLDGTDLVVKSFRVPGGIKALIYGRGRKSKARRSFEHAERLRSLGIETPEPVAFVERHRRGLLRESYYICRFYPHDFSMEAALSSAGEDASPNDREAIIEAFTRFTFRLHEAGVLHRDHNAGNTLVRGLAGDWAFALIDINRMRFGPLALEQRLNNFVRLTDDIASMRLMARVYAGLAGQDPRDCERLLLECKRRHWRRLSRKKWVKRMLGKRAP